MPWSHLILSYPTKLLFSGTKTGFYSIRRFIAVFTKARQSLLQDALVELALSRSASQRSFLVLSSGSSKRPVREDLQLKNEMQFTFSPCVHYVPLMNLSPLQY
jgi:hypothetical protein